MNDLSDDAFVSGITSINCRRHLTCESRDACPGERERKYYLRAKIEIRVACSSIVWKCMPNVCS